MFFLIFCDLACFDWDWWCGAILQPALPAFITVMFFQILREIVSEKHYMALWQLLLVPSAIWGGIALAEYIPNIFIWKQETFLLPAIAYGVGIAKVKKWLPIKQYLIFFIVILLLPFCVFEVIDLFGSTIYSSELSVERGRGGGVGYGLAGINYRSSYPTINWSLFKIPGVFLLVSILAVPPNLILVNRMLKKIMPKGNE